MAQSATQELVDRFITFYRNYYRDEIGQLAQQYPNEKRSLYVDYDDLYRFDADLADDFLAQPEQLQEYAEEALRLYDLPADVKLGQAHVRLRNVPSRVTIRAIRVHDDHVGRMVAVSGIVRKATDVRPRITEAAFECQRCGTMTYIPQSDSGFQEPHECQGCERQGPFRVNFDQSEFVDSQKLRIQESPEGLRGGETPQSIDISIEDDITGAVTPGDHVTVTGVLHIEQQTDNQQKTPIFDLYMDGVAIEIEDEEFEDMDITEEDKRQIVELSSDPDLYETMVDSIAPAIYGYREEKLAMILQIFSGVTKHLPDGSRIRGDLHMLLIGDPGTGKCVKGDTKVTVAAGEDVSIRELVESNLDDPKPIDDGVYDAVDLALPTVRPDGVVEPGRATTVWKREAPAEMLRIRTTSGHDIEVTPSHPLFVRDGDRLEAVRADDLRAGRFVAVDGRSGGDAVAHSTVLADGPATVPDGGSTVVTGDVRWDRVESIETVAPDYDWVYDLEVEGTHTYLSNGFVSHNSQMLSYIRNIAPRAVYTSGKGSSAAGLTAAAVRSDFGDGDQWTLEAGALVLADKGIAAVDELDKMRCVTGDTLVHLGDGTVTRVRDLAHRKAVDGSIERHGNGRTIRDVDVDAWTMTDDGRLVRRPVTAIHEYDAPGELTEVRLESGEPLTATHDHPFFVFEDGQRVERGAAELSPGDWVYVPRELRATATDGGVSTVESPTEASDRRAGSSDEGAVDPEMGAVLGYLAGDGNLYTDQVAGTHGIRFTNAEPELLAHFESVSADAFDATPVRHPSEQRDDGVGTVRVHGIDVADAVVDAGMNSETYDGNRLPDAIGRSSRATKAAFVRAFADSEGTVGTRSVKIASSSRELLLAVKHLLLEFGVSTQVQCRTRDGRDLYVLAITDAESLRAFRREIGFTLDRKATTLAEACRTVSGDRTVLDVIPDCGDLLLDLRTSLRLHQSECGLRGGTYCDFENGHANVSIQRARDVLEAFSQRVGEATRDARELSDTGSDWAWDELDRLRDRYHVTQSEVADGTRYSQQQVSRRWGTDPDLKSVVRARLDDIVSDVARVDPAPLRTLVEGDVKWRRVEQVSTVERDGNDDGVAVLRRTLATELRCGKEDAIELARELLATPPSIESWGDLSRELDRHDVPHRAVADRIGVAPSTVSRWTRGVVDSGGRFEKAREAAMACIDERRARIETHVDEIDARRQPSVYDLTVEGTHNFVANGMIVHNSEDRSAMHEALEQQQISVAKAGINATLKSRCSLLGAANPKYGRFDQYESIGEQIDLEPALISRFDLIFTVTDQPDPEHDRNLAEHIINTNYAGELNTQRTELPTSNFSQEHVDEVTEEVAPEIPADLLRKYVAYAKRNCFPTMTEEAKEIIRDFYVDLRSKGADEDAPVPVTARKLEAVVRLAEASARVRLSDTVEVEDAERVTAIVESCLRDIGVDPETGQFDADVVETGTSKSQRDRIKNLKTLIQDIEDDYEDGAPLDEVYDRAEEIGMDQSKVEDEIRKLKNKGDIYEPRQDHLRVV